MPPELQHLGPVVVSLSGWDILYHSERLNKSAWSNQPVAHETAKLRELCRKANPQLIVELGSRLGGTALALHDAAPDARLLSFDTKCTKEVDLIHDFELLNSSYAGYDNKEFWTRRSWFPMHVLFINADFAADYKFVCQLCSEMRIYNSQQPAFFFVDGDFGNKPADAERYANFLLPGDIMAVNNYGDEWDTSTLDAILLPKGYERWEFDWCQQVGLMLTRAWRKV